jgi:hypothetical protein
MKRLKLKLKLCWDLMNAKHFSVMIMTKSQIMELVDEDSLGVTVSWGGMDEHTFYKMIKIAGENKSFGDMIEMEIQRGMKLTTNK